MMTNKEYYDYLEKILNRISTYRKEGLEIFSGIIGRSLFAEDLFFSASLDRCLRLIDGMSDMLRNRNLTCAGAILRLQMDNCMRTYAVYIAENRKKVVDCLLLGKPINKEKDVNGKKLSDGHLKDEVSKIDDRFKTVYDQASGFIHLSEKAFYQTIVNTDTDGMVMMQIGDALPQKRNEPLIECAEAFLHFIKLHYSMLYPVVDSKTRFEKENQNQE